MPPGGAEAAPKRLDRLTLPETMQTTLAPVRTMLTALNATLETLEVALDARAAADVSTQRLMTAPAVGPILALTFQAVLDRPERFGGDPARASAFVGVVPSEDSSAERQQKGHITKAGPGELRALLVQACWGIWRSRRASAATLRTWAEALAARRGRRIAVIALARRLTRILYAMWRDGTVFHWTRQTAVVPAA